MALPSHKADKENQRFEADADNSVTVRVLAEMRGRKQSDGLLKTVAVDDSGKLLVAF